MRATPWLKQGIQWSATGALAADVIAPHLTEVAPLEIYVQAKSHADLRQTALAAGVSERNGGRRLLRPFPTPAGDALSSLEGTTCVVCWPRVYADLRATGVRGEDAAEHLRARMAKAHDVDEEPERPTRGRRAAGQASRATELRSAIRDLGANSADDHAQGTQAYVCQHSTNHPETDADTAATDAQLTVEQFTGRSLAAIEMGN